MCSILFFSCTKLADVNWICDVIKRSKFKNVTIFEGDKPNQRKCIAPLSEFVGLCQLLDTFNSIVVYQILRENTQCYSIVLPNKVTQGKSPAEVIQLLRMENSRINIEFKHLIENKETVEFFFNTDNESVPRIERQNGFLSFDDKSYPVFNMELSQCKSCGSFDHKECSTLRCFECGEITSHPHENCNPKCSFCYKDHGLNSIKCQSLIDTIAKLSIDARIWPGTAFVKTIYSPTSERDDNRKRRFTGFCKIYGKETQVTRLTIPFLFTRSCYDREKQEYVNYVLYEPDAVKIEKNRSN